MLVGMLATQHTAWGQTPNKPLRHFSAAEIGEDTLHAATLLPADSMKVDSSMKACSNSSFYSNTNHQNVLT